LPVDRPHKGHKYLIVSPTYSIFDQETDTVTAPGGLAPIFKCLVAFACCNLEGFNVPEPSLRLFETLEEEGEEEEEEEEDEEGANNVEYEDGIHSIGLYFDQFGIGQALKDSVCGKPGLVFFF
jgi:hypothetical protein